MPNREPRDHRPTDTQNQLLTTAIVALQVALDCEVLGVIGLDVAEGVFIVPRPGDSKMLFSLLADCDWASTKRIAEEHAE